MFQLARNRSTHGLELAQKFWDFLTLEVGKRMEITQQRATALEWAGEFDKLLLDQPYGHVCAVLDYYRTHWHEHPSEEEWLCGSAQTFIKRFDFYDRRYRWNRRPIPDKELMPILAPLWRERWACDWEAVVTAVSQSLDNVRRFCASMDGASIPDDVKRWIRGMIGSMTEYVKNHFSKWRMRQTGSVWTAMITQETLFEAAHTRLVRAGYSMGYSQRCLRILRSSAQKEEETCPISA